MDSRRREVSMASLKFWAEGSWATISPATLSQGCSESTHDRLVSQGSRLSRLPGPRFSPTVSGATA